MSASTLSKAKEASVSDSAKKLIQSAAQEGTISPATAKALTVHDVGMEIEAALGVNVDDVKSTEVVLVTFLIDDSGSIEGAGNTANVMLGHNLVLDALMKTKQKNNILVHTRTLNGTIITPYCLLENAVQLDASNYFPVGGTPLYDETVVILGTVIAKTEQFSKNAVPVRTVTIIITDSCDLHSRKYRRPQDVAPIVQDMFKTEQHIIAGMGIDDHQTDFKKVFGDMGILPQWILTPDNDPHEIRKAFLMVSQSATKISQNAQGFAQASLGGFGKTAP
ncbi:MAG: hypothetical protein WCW00_03345 [Candidatus Paceibacterota bacterium]